MILCPFTTEPSRAHGISIQHYGAREAGCPRNGQWHSPRLLRVQPENTLRPTSFPRSIEVEKSGYSLVQEFLQEVC